MPDSSATNDPPDVDLSGRQIGDYRLLRRLGRGGMANVYLAEQLSLRRNVALKILKPELATDESYVKRFEREAQAAAALVQANIVQIYEVGRDGPYHYIAQEYVRGRNLKQYLDRHGAVESVMAINVLRQASLALQKAVEFGVVHRDIKPENIMLSTKGEVKIADFGLARVNGSQAEQALTQIGVTMGTPLYMSPEQVGGQPLDHRSDIYSLGVTAYQMLAGEPPFNGDNALAIAVQHINESPASLASQRPDIPVELAQLIAKMMAKKPGQRHADPSQLLKELRTIKVDVDEDWEMIVEKLSVADTLGIGATSTSLSQSQLAATRQLQMAMKGNVRTWWRSPLLWISSGLLGLAGLGTGVYCAAQTKNVSLLEIESIENERIPKEENIVKQYHQAILSPMDQHEVYLKKVIEYFPEGQASAADLNKTKLYSRRAHQRLGEWYIMNQRWSDSEKEFLFLTQTEELAEEFQVSGYAGLAITYFNMTPADFVGGAAQQKEKIIDAIRGVRDRDKLLNSMLASLFVEVQRNNSPELLTPKDNNGTPTINTEGLGN